MVPATPIRFPGPSGFATVARRLFALTAAFALCFACAAYGADEPDDAAAPADEAATEDAATADDAAPAAEEATTDDPADAPADEPAADESTDVTDPAADDPAAEPTEDPSAGTVRERPVRRPRSYPEPSPYPVAWEFKFDWRKPKRVIVPIAGASRPRAYWYLPYTVTNNGEQEELFLPRFELVTEDGKIHVSDRGIPKEVFDYIKAREGNRLLEPPAKVVGAIRLGADEARDSVAIWPEPKPEMGEFQIFVSGLSGEFIELTDDEGKLVRRDPKDPASDPVILRKTLQLTYTLAGDELYAGIDPLIEGEIRLGRNARRWIMR